MTGRHVRQGSHTVQMDVFLSDTGMFEKMLYNLRMYHSDVRKGGITLPLLEMTIVDGGPRTIVQSSQEIGEMTLTLTWLSINKRFRMMHRL